MPKIYANRWLVLALLALAQFMIVLDVSIVNVALPSIENTLGLSVTDLQWVVSAYTLAFGGFLFLGGRTADLYGRRRVFMSGVVGFSIVSLLIGLTQSGTLLIVLRALQGLCAAFMSPAALSIVLTTFKEGGERNRALSVWGAVAAGGASAGLLLGGILTQYLNWRYNFFVNVPIGIGVFAASAYLLPAHAAEEHSKSLDLPGAVLVTSGLMVLVYALTNAHAWGWFTPAILGLFALAFALLIAFVYNESRAKHPLVPLSIFKVGNIAGANITLMPITASLFSSFFFLTLYLQNILHYSPLRSGLSFLPMSIVIAVSAILAPNVIRRVGYKTVLVIAPLFVATGLYILSGVDVGGSYWSVLPALLIMPIGLGFSFVSSTIAATTGVPGHEAGLASGLLTTSQQVGGSVGLAILSSIAASTTASLIAQNATMPSALVGGFHSAFYTGMGFAILASLSAFFLIKQRRGGASASVVTQAHSA
jgi:EmrB/QacA subfamily drug resistance transporter